MFDIEVKKLYEEIQQKLKSNSETAFINVNQEISSIRNNIISRINDMISSYGIKLENNLIENIVDETLMEDLKNTNQNTLSKNYKTLYQFNDSIQAVIIQRAKEQTTKESKQEQIKIIMDKFDYTMSAYKESKINLLEQYNKLFQTILRKAPLYTTPELVEDIKMFLQREKGSMEQYIQNERNNIITSNLNSLIDSNTYLTQQTDFISTELSQTIEEVQEQVQEVEKQVEEQILESYKSEEKIEEEIKEKIVPIQNDYQQPQTNEEVIVTRPESQQQEIDESKNLYAPSFVSSESHMIREETQVETEQDYRILNDGTIEWLKPRNIQPIPEEYQQVDSAPSKVDNEIMLINIVKENINQNLWNEIGIIASNTDNTINIISNQISRETQAILQKYGINSNSIMTQRIVQQLDNDLKEINNNLSENMIKSFTKINNDTMNAISQTFARPEEIRNQDVEQCMEVYKGSTSLASFKLTCQKQFEQCMSKICYQYNISRNSNAYNELFRTFENKRMQMESQFYNMYMTFSNSNSMFIEKAIGSTMISQEMMREMQQDLSPQQIQTMIGFNYQEYEKNYYEMKAQRDLEQISNMSR